MNIVENVSQKFHGLFDPLISAYQNSKPDGRVKQRQKKMIEDLLGTSGDVIQMHLNGENHQNIAIQLDISEKEVAMILIKYNKRNITSCNIEDVIYRSQIEDLKRKYKYLFDPLLDKYFNVSMKDETEDKKEVFKLIRNLLHEEMNHGEVVKLYNEGFTLQMIGDQYSVTRERIRQIIKIYEGYYIVAGSQEWCLKELEILTISQKQNKKLPSNQDLNKHHPKLVKSLRKCFLDNQFIKDKEEEYLNYDERLEIARNIGYDTFIGTKDWCLEELNKIVILQGDTKILPSNKELDLHHLDLAPTLREHFTHQNSYGKLSEQDRLEVINALGYDVTEEIKKQKKWTKERLIYEVREAAKQLGNPDLMPRQKDLTQLDRTDLRGAIGQSKVAQLAGLIYQGQTVGEDGRTYWTEERIRAFLYDVAEKEGHPYCMPTQSECAKHHQKGNVIVAIFTNAGNRNKPTITWPELAKKYGLKYDLDFQRVTLAYIKSFVKSLGDSLYNLTSSEIYSGPIWFVNKEGGDR